MGILEKITQKNRERGLKNRKEGLGFEFEILRELRHKGVTIRSAGSHSLIDIVHISKGKILLINCKKNGVWVSTETAELVKLQKENMNTTVVKAFKHNGKTIYKKVV